MEGRASEQTERSDTGLEAGTWPASGGWFGCQIDTHTRPIMPRSGRRSPGRLARRHVVGQEDR